MCAPKRPVGDRCCRVKLESASENTPRGLWFKRQGKCFQYRQEAHEAGKRDERKRESEREREKVNARNRWPTDQALPHQHRRRHQQWSVRESGEAAGGGRRAQLYLTRRTRLCEGSHVRRLLMELSLGRHEAALQPEARAPAVRQGLIIKEPN